MLRNSTSTRIGFTPIGTGGLNICPQKCLLLLSKITMKEITPSIIVNAILPVTLAVPGINPIILFMSIKKKTVNR